MSVSYYAKDTTVMGRQIEVQKLSIPFVIVGSATAASVSATSDEPSILFFQTSGVDQITPELALIGDSVTLANSPSDSGGVFNVLIVLNQMLQDDADQATKIVSIHCKRYTDAIATSVEQSSCQGSASGGLTANGNMVVTITSSQALNASNTLSGTLEIEYTCKE